jgi:large subunit ribosomal protein L9
MKPVKLLLVENVDNLGIVGDVVKVRPGYARNFLLPRGLATTPSEGAVKRLAEKRAKVEAELKALRVQLEELHKKIEGHELTMQRSANEQGILFGGVSQHDIATALRAEGFPIDDRAVRIGEQIKRLDSYEIPIVLANDLRTQIKLWVVSDKPAGQTDEQTEAEADQPAEQPAEKA